MENWKLFDSFYIFQAGIGIDYFSPRVDEVNGGDLFHFVVLSYLTFFEAFEVDELCPADVIFMDGWKPLLFVIIKRDRNNF